MKLKMIWLLLFVILLAFVLRIYKLDQVPTSLYWDEAAMALDAKSISLTGKDQHGNSWLQPIFPSWGDYKLPVYILTAVPFFKLFPNNPDLAVRLPSAIAGTLTILAIYLLTKELLYESTLELPSNATSEALKNYLPIVASLLLAISPWHLQFSRAAFEANLALLFNSTTLLFFLKSIKNKIWLIPGVIIGALGIYTYYSSRIVIPFLIIFSLVCLSKKQVINKGVWFAISLIIIIILSLPLKYSSLAEKAEQFRLSTKNILSNPEIIDYSTKLFQDDGDTFLAKKIHHRWLYQAKDLIRHIFDHLSFSFLVLSGDSNLRHSTGSVGVLLFIPFIGLICGEYFLYLSNKRLFIFLNLSLIICLLPASATYEVPHGLRSLNAVIFFNIISAYGLVQLFIKFNNRYLPFTFCLLLLFQFAFYLHDYYIHYPDRSYFAWQGGYKEAIKVVDYYYQQADKVIFTDNYARPYIYFLLYSSYPLNKFQEFRQNILKIRPTDYLEASFFDKIEFRKPDVADEVNSKVLIIAAPGEIPAQRTQVINNNFILWKNF